MIGWLILGILLGIIWSQLVGIALDHALINSRRRDVLREREELR